jgi:tetrapyrrole methylase family protein/MazG family protein
MSRLHLVGLGPGAAELLTLRSWELLASGKPLRIRDPSQEAAQTILARGFNFETVSETDPEAIAASIIRWARRCESCVYAVAGHPLEAPEAVPILRAAASAGVEVAVEPAVMDLDRLPAADPMTGTFAGPAALRGAIAFERLVAIMARLRSPDGCPWDRAQSHESLAIHLLEETHEVLDAIDRRDMVDLEEELGDLLLQIVFHAQLAGDAGDFEIGDVVEELIAKLVYRHPHIFGDVTVGGADEVVANWESLKHEQKGRTTRADGIPKDLPALLYAHKVQRRISGAGRAWKASMQHLSTLVDAAASAGGPEADSVFGDLLFEVVALAQQAGVDPEGALRRRATQHLLDSPGGAPDGLVQFPTPPSD